MKAFEKRWDKDAATLPASAAELIDAMQHLCHASAASFCLAVWHIAFKAKAASSPAMLDAGVIPILFQLLATHMSDRAVVSAACVALYDLARYGSPAVRKAARQAPDCEAILRAAVATRFVMWDDHTNGATEVLLKLGMTAA